MKNVIMVFLVTFGYMLFFQLGASDLNNITPYKYANPKNIPVYEIPASTRFTVQRVETTTPDIVYYLSMPKAARYPIAIVLQTKITLEV